MMCDNKAAAYIVRKLVFHKWMKQIEVDCHDLAQTGVISMLHVTWEDQAAYIFTSPHIDVFTRS